jgi:hypothetical protein
VGRFPNGRSRRDLSGTWPINPEEVHAWATRDLSTRLVLVAVHESHEVPGRVDPGLVDEGFKFASADAADHLLVAARP